MSDYDNRILNDADRIQAFARAIRRQVSTQDVVVDLGTGLGTYAMLAAQAGAKRSIGIEFDSIINVARQIALQNNLDVEFIRGDALDVELSERATLLIFEDFSSGLLDGPAPPLLAAARKQLVAPSCRILPQGAELEIAPVASQRAHDMAFPNRADDYTCYGLNFQPLQYITQNSVHHIRSPGDLALLADPVVVLRHSFEEDLPQKWAADVTFELAAEQTLAGVCLWHNLVVDEQNRYSNAPGEAAIGGQYFFAIPEVWDVKPGQRLRCEVAFQRISVDGFWRWNLQLFEHQSETACRTSTGNTFAASPITSAAMNAFYQDEVISLTSRAKLEALVLSAADGNKSIREIHEILQEHAPEMHEDSLEFVLGVLENRRLATAVVN